LLCPMPGIFQLHGDHVGGISSVAGFDGEQRVVQRLCRWQRADRGQPSPRGPVGCDLLGQDAQAATGRQRPGGAGKGHRA